MRYREICESKWWDDRETITLYHGTSSALLPLIRDHGLRRPTEDLREYAHEILAQYIPREQWTAKLLKLVDEHAIRNTSGRAGDRGAVLYFMTDPEGPSGYARSMAKHGGEIASDVFTCVCLFLKPKGNFPAILKDPPIPPRFHEAHGVVVEVEVPKSWCLFGMDIAPYRDRLLAAHAEGKNFAQGFDSVEEFLDDVFDNREVRVPHDIPPHMIKSVRAAKE